MSDTWKQLDLEGGGLQAVNAAIVKAMRRRRTAYLLWFLFPIGLHRFYLKSKFGFLIYLALSAIVLVAWFYSLLITQFSGGALALLALADLIWIDRRVNKLNKELRLRAYLQPEHQPPPHFRGRYSDDPDAVIDQYVAEKAREVPAERRVGQLPKESANPKILSFAEQEKLLREIKQRSNPHGS